MKRLVSIIVLAAGALFVWGQRTEPRVRLELERDTIELGDQITLSVVIDKDLAQDVRVPQFENNMLMEGIEILGTPAIDTLKRDGRELQLRLRYLITSFDAGRYTMKEFPVVVGVEPKFDTVRSADSVVLTVSTFEIDTTTMQIFDIKQPLDAPVVWAEVAPYVWWGLLGLAVLGGLVWLLVWWRKKRKAALAAAAEPIHVRAIRQLEELHSQKLWQSGKAKEYFSELTDILRTYLEGRYGIEAMEMTSAEIVGALSDINEPKLIEQLRAMFSVADLVKFAKMIPEGTECETAYFDVYYYVEQTKEIVVEPEEEPNPDEDKE